MPRSSLGRAIAALPLILSTGCIAAQKAESAQPARPYLLVGVFHVGMPKAAAVKAGAKDCHLSKRIGMGEYVECDVPHPAPILGRFQPNRVAALFAPPKHTVVSQLTIEFKPSTNGLAELLTEQLGRSIGEGRALEWRTADESLTLYPERWSQGPTLTVKHVPGAQARRDIARSKDNAATRATLDKFAAPPAR